MHYPKFARLRFAIALCALITSFTAHAQPNIVFILVDDMGYGDLACYGAPDARTPNIDQLAKEGVKFTQFYAMGAECSPSRTAFLTGRYPQRAGGLECAIGTGNVGRYDDAIRLAENNDLGLPASYSVLGRGLKAAGYNNAVYGKWHMGYEEKFFPSHHGFDDFIGFLGGNVDYFRHKELSPIHALYHNNKPIERSGYMTHLITEDAIRFIEKKRKSPFFLYLAYSTPHFPFQAPGDDTGKMHPEDQFTTGTRAKYVELLEDMDTQVGRVLSQLKKQGLSKETLFVFASDHGAMKPGRNLPFNGWKGGLMEGGIRVPCIARWPGRLSAGLESDRLGTLMDLTKSFLRVADAKTPDNKPLDGIDILRHVENDSNQPKRDLYWRARRGDRTWKAIRSGDMKLVSKQEAGETETWLFDLAKDPSETNNLLSKETGTHKRLLRRLTRWEKKVAPTR